MSLHHLPGGGRDDDDKGDAASRPLRKDRAAPTLRAARASVMVPCSMVRSRPSPPSRVRLTPPGRRPSGVLALTFVAVFAAACGHPASEAECRTILERIVELELKSQKVTDPAEIAKRRAESLGLSVDGGRTEVLDGCIGRHVTDRALACVRAAEAASDITDRCLQ